MIAGIRINLLLVLFSVYWMAWTASNPAHLTRIERSAYVVTQYLNDSWAVWYATLDVNRDSKLSIVDRDICRNGLVGAYNLSLEDKEDTESKMNYWWNNLIFNGNESNELSLNNFINILTGHYLGNKTNFRANAVVFHSIILEAADVNENGKMSLNETINLFRAFGILDESLTEDYFNAFDPKQGEVPFDNISRAWADFTIIDHNNTNNFIRYYINQFLG